MPTKLPGTVTPDLTGFTTLTDPNPGANWTPALSPNTDYVLQPAAGQTQPRDHQIILQGGRNIYLSRFWLTRGDSNGGPCIMLDGRNATGGGWVFLEGVLMDCTGGFESDGIRSRSSVIAPYTGTGLTDLYLLNSRIMGLRGQTDNGASTLNGAILAGDTSITVNAGTQFNPPCTVQIDSEFLHVTNQAGNVLTVVRGQIGSTAAGHANGAAVTQTNDYGGPTSGTHADCVQLAGGLGDFTSHRSTYGSGYSLLQLQQEQVETGAYGTITNLTRVGSTATLTTSAAHGLVVGNYIQVGNGVAGGSQACVPSAWNGTYRVDQVLSATQLQFDLTSGRALPGVITNLGSNPTWKKSLVQYTVGNITIADSNFQCAYNPQCWFTQAPGETLNALRWGGRPDYKGYEDMTNVIGAWAGQGSLSNVYLDLFNTGAAGVLNPGISSNIWPTALGQLNGGLFSWPSWPQITGQVQVTPPPNGDFAPAYAVGLRYPGSKRRGLIRV